MPTHKYRALLLGGVTLVAVGLQTGPVQATDSGCWERDKLSRSQGMPRFDGNEDDTLLFEPGTISFTPNPSDLTFPDSTWTVYLNPFLTPQDAEFFCIWPCLWIDSVRRWDSTVYTFPDTQLYWPGFEIDQALAEVIFDLDSCVLSMELPGLTGVIAPEIVGVEFERCFRMSFGEHTLVSEVITAIGFALWDAFPIPVPKPVSFDASPGYAKPLREGAHPNASLLGLQYGMLPYDSVVNPCGANVTRMLELVYGQWETYGGPPESMYVAIVDDGMVEHRDLGMVDTVYSVWHPS